MSQQINLLGPLLLKKRQAFGLREMAAGGGAVLAAVLTWGGYLHHQASALEARAAEQEARQAEAQQELDALAAAAARPASALLAARVRTAQAQVARHEALLAALGGTTAQAATGFAPRMRALAQGAAEGVWLNGFTLAQDQVVLKGSALNADLLTTYLDRLGMQPAFAGTPFSGLDAAAVRVAGVPGEDGNPAAQPPGHIDFALRSGGQAGATHPGGRHEE